MVFEKEIASNLDCYLFNQVEKNASEVIFTAVADLLVHLSPNLPAVFFMVCSLIFLCLKKCFSLPYCYMKKPYEQQSTKEAVHSRSPVKCAKQTGSSRAQLPAPAPLAALLPYPSNGIGQPGAKLLLRTALLR